MVQMRLLMIIPFLFLLACGPMDKKAVNVEDKSTIFTGIELIVLGTVQDGGAPHIGCSKACCLKLWTSPNSEFKVVSLGIIDHDDKKTFMIEATPDFPNQLAYLNKIAGAEISAMPEGIVLTHAHIGHYTGLMYLGREAKGAKDVPVYCMPKFQEFLMNNGPWDQLVKLNNIKLESINDSISTPLSPQLSIQPFTVPHRDEYSETVGFIINGSDKSALFIPDIDKWTKWDEDISAVIEQVDYAFLDATFYDGNEINNRDISEIPHPFVIESMELFQSLSAEHKKKIYFIHLNHTNPLLDHTSDAYHKVMNNGYNIAQFGQRFRL